MTPKDVIKQMFDNDPENWDQVDTFSLVIYDPVFRGIKYVGANVDLGLGVFELWNGDGEASDIVLRLAIKVELVEITK